MIYILQIDTSGIYGTVVLTANGEPYAVAVNEQAREHAATIHLQIDKVLATAGITMGQLHAVAVCAGPGSYTGLRIGLATAKGLCYALDIPLLLSNKLTLLAHQSVMRQPPTIASHIIICKARQGEYFAAGYDQEMHPLLEPRHIEQAPLWTWIESLTGNIRIMTDQEEPETTFPTGKHIHVHPLENIDIKIWGDLTYKDYKNKKIADLAAATPFYMKEVHINKPK